MDYVYFLLFPIIWVEIFSPQVNMQDCCCLVTESCPTLWRPRGLQPTRLFCPWDFPGKNTGMGCHFLLQGIFSTQRLNLHLLQVSCIESRFFTTEPLGKPLSSFLRAAQLPLAPWYQVLSAISSTMRVGRSACRVVMEIRCGLHGKCLREWWTQRGCLRW